MTLPEARHIQITNGLTRFYLKNKVDSREVGYVIPDAALVSWVDYWVYFVLFAKPSPTFVTVAIGNFLKQAHALLQISL